MCSALRAILGIKFKSFIRVYVYFTISLFVSVVSFLSLEFSIWSYGVYNDGTASLSCENNSINSGSVA